MDDYVCIAIKDTLYVCWQYSQNALELGNPGWLTAK
jgi:hypothetical protein